MDAELAAAESDPPCKCGHPRLRHAMLRARCTLDGCTCVHYEPKQKWSLVGHAVNVEDELELARKEIRRLRAQLDVALDDQPLDVQELSRELEKLRDGLRAITSNPESTRAAVQAQAIRLLGL